MSVRVKICGITRLEDARAAVEAGADALGFMFYEPSLRRVRLPEAAAIARQIPPFVARVGVFVNPDPAFVRQAVEACGLDTLQFHGEESPEFCAQFSLRQIKAFRVRDESTLQDCLRYPDRAWLLDSYVPGQLGGTGAVFNWALAARAKETNPWIILAGGLTPENIAQAVGQTRPYGVDVSSGVESAPGIKDARLIQAFVRAAKTA